MRLKRYRAVVISKLLSIGMKAGKVEVKKMALCLATPFSENLEDVAALGLTEGELLVQKVGEASWPLKAGI